MAFTFTAIRKFFARKVVKVLDRRVVRARYDATTTGHENRNHWAAADFKGPINANSTHVRGILSRRARLERENDPHFFGMTKIHAYSFVGTGPRLQLALDADQYEDTRIVEQEFAKWSRATDYADKLRILVEACPVDGETFGQLVINPAVMHRVKLDLKVMEQEQIATPNFGSNSDNLIDGIDLDANGNVQAYHVLREHPGDAVTANVDYDVIAASNMVHWFRPFRPGQARGVSEFASSIETCAQNRRYAKATLGKQEINANITGVIETENMAIDDSGEEKTFKTMEEVDVPRMGLMSLPGGMKAKPFSSAENTTGFKEYMGMNYGAIGRPNLIPRNLITGDSSDFNFASGRMDHLPYQMSVWIDRERIRTRVLDKVFRAWYAAAKEAGLIPANLPPLMEWVWDWHWDGFPSIDAVKDTTAQEKRLALGLTSLAEECAAEGKDWREVARQRAIEQKYYKQLGITDPYAALIKEPAAPSEPAPTQDDDEPPAGDVDASHEDDTKLEPRYGRPAYV